ncbi:helix-turn-helix transcriptional regulator [Flavobacteriaceae bacterium TP-CH-4]|uniref:Helix-turn-helix transcriptional regulator n=1 Tax=Pelagihabitans pacificus TaxID=2696054 RepID=A0A967E5I8_9FLAO|nr:helix-turn-helix transcriptional regulator [Pelagihabitans pacificus]NHF58129.1 helix-turn-helix transcriptional regulator [Pelagihabitans pacificus]
MTVFSAPLIFHLFEIVSQKVHGTPFGGISPSRICIFGTRMDYKTLHFHQEHFLAPFVELGYVMSNSEKALEYKTITNGVIGLGVILDGNAYIKERGQWTTIPRFSIFGMSDKSYQIKLSAAYKEISVGFKPYYFNLFVKEGLNEFTKGKVIDAESVFGRDALHRLFEKVRNEPSQQLLATYFSDFFQRQFLSKKTNQKVLFATKMIYQDDANKVDDIAQKLNVSTTTVRNLFKHHIGVSPKELIKITRTHRALNYQKKQVQTLTELGLQLGYFDQSHFIREFKAIVGVSPKTYFKSEKLAFDFYNYGRWLSDNFAE